MHTSYTTRRLAVQIAYVHAPMCSLARGDLGTMEAVWYPGLRRVCTCMYRSRHVQLRVFVDG